MHSRSIDLNHALAGFGIPSFACTPDKFPELMAAAIKGRDLGRWAADERMTATSAKDA